MMRLIIVAYICLLLWAFNADSNNAKDDGHTQSVGNQTTQVQAPTPARAITQPGDSTTHKGNDNPRPSYRDPGWIAVILTAIYVGATIKYVSVSRQMLDQISKQGETALVQLSVMSDQTEAMQKLWHATHEQGITMMEQLEELKRLADQTTIAAKAAESSAIAAMESVRVQESHLSQCIVVSEWKSVKIDDDSLLYISCNINNPSPFPMTLNFVEAKTSVTWGSWVINGVTHAKRILAPHVPYVFHFEVELTERMIKLYESGTTRITIDCSIGYLNVTGKETRQRIFGNLFCGSFSGTTFIDFINTDSTPDKKPDT
jgi:hypothetical protein